MRFLRDPSRSQKAENDGGVNTGVQVYPTLLPFHSNTPALLLLLRRDRDTLGLESHLKGYASHRLQDSGLAVDGVPRYRVGATIRTIEELARGIR